MAIIKDVTVKINNGTATLDAPVQFYEKDHDVELRFRLMDYKYKYDKDPQNILNSVDEDVLEAYTTIVNPRGYELEQINGVVKNDVVIFRLDPTYTDELDELGTYKLQIHIKCTHSEFTIPPITFEVLQRLKGIKVVTDGEDEVDNSEILDNSSKFVSDETGKLIIEWKKGDMISSAKLNAMVDVINDAVDEEKIRQENEKEREKKANNKIQELENTRVEYVNKFDDELDSFADQVDTTMSDYETRFNALTVSQQQDAEIIDARDGEQTLRARLDRDIQKPSIIYEEVEGSCINVNTTCGYAQNVEIIGNTIQNQNDLADIRSVGDKLENQELYEIPVLSCGKNLFHPDKLIIDSKNNYGYFYIGNASNYTVSIKDKDTSVDIQGLYFGLSMYGASSTGGVSWNVDNGKIRSTKNTHQVYKYFSIHPNTKEALEKLTQRFYVQIEEGTVATEYEPYVEDKLTILSPTPLEKVGDVADRIICKDGVWGVEKNISTTVFDGSEHWRYHSTIDNTSFFQLSISSSIYGLPKNDNTKANILSNRFLNTVPNIGYNNDIEGIYLDTRTNLSVRILNTKLNTQDLAGFKSWLSENPILLKYQLAQPTFIPLPHNQQINLRTFANKTNISFQCEIEPTLKASVPKSIGATVNSHSEQIDNLSKELEKINNLEESVASEVVTESDFTTVENTSNGYFEDVKLEGRTLVNLNDIPHDWILNPLGNIAYLNGKVNKYLLALKPDTTYTVVLYGLNDKFTSRFVITDTMSEYVTLSNGIGTIKTKTDIDNSKDRNPHIYGENLTAQDLENVKLVILEGDHTQNPPSYFEGLKSVGQDVDEISVLSVKGDGNLCEGNELNISIKNGVSDTFSKDIVFRPTSDSVAYFVDCEGGQLGNVNVAFKFLDKSKNVLGTPHYTTTNQPNYKFKFSDRGIKYSDVYYLKVFWNDKVGKDVMISNLTFISGNVAPTKHITHQQNKKPILYYNPTTDTWEKPVLRQWDSIEKHTDGKYYYHKRSGEVVLNGDEKYDWCYYSYGGFGTDIPNLKRNINGSEITSYSISNSLTPVTYNELSSVGSGYYSIHYTISRIVIKSDCATTDEFEDWLRSNPVIIVYQLETEEVYECTSIDLITYENETNFIVNAGAIAPVSTLKVMCNINNVVRELQQKVSNLENYIQHVMIDALNNALNE